MLMGQGGHRISGIAEAHGMGLQPAMWFDLPTDYVLLASPTTGILGQTSNFMVSFTGFIPVSAGTVFQNFFANRQRGTGVGWSIQHRDIGGIKLNFRRGNSDFVTAPIIGSIFTVACYQNNLTAKIFMNGVERVSTSPVTILYEDPYNPQFPAAVGIQRTTLTSLLTGVAYDIRLHNITGLSVAQCDAIAVNPASATPSLYLAGRGITNNDWLDTGSEAIHHGTVIGTPELCYIRADGKIIKDGIIMNP